MLKITNDIVIPDHEIEIGAVRAQGAGGQNVNKVSSAVHLRFDIRRSEALPEAVKSRLLESRDRRITAEGVLVIKARRSRSLARNREDALERLADFIRSGLRTRKKRLPTKPGEAARQRRLADKARRSRLKQTRARLKD